MGYNNSGKTYMGQLLWSLFALKKEEYAHQFISSVSELQGEIEVSETDIKKVIEEFEEFLQKAFLQKTLNLNKEHFLGESFKMNLIGDYLSEFYAKETVIRGTMGKMGEYMISKNKSENKLGYEIGNGANLERIKTLAKRPYTQPMDELNKRVFNLNNTRTPTGHYEDLLTELEEIMGGEIEVIAVEGIAPIEFRLKIAEGKSLDMHIASSSSNQLTTLYLYLKYWASSHNNFLIIDEPEENLHPKNQLKLLELLIKFSKRNNNRILITTHSTLLSDSINNHLNLGHLKNEGFDLEEIAKDKNLNIDTNTALEPDETGVYFFNGSRIFEYGVGDYGVVFNDFVQEERKVRDNSSALKGLIFEYQNKKLEEVSNA